MVGYIDVGDGCWRPNVLMTICDEDVGHGFGHFGHQYLQHDCSREFRDRVQSGLG